MGKQSITTDLAALGGLSLTPGSMGRQLAARLREAIETGQLRPGDRLPASRTLARKLGLARGTVADVYSQLVAEGLSGIPRGRWHVCGPRSGHNALCRNPTGACPAQSGYGCSAALAQGPPAVPLS